MPFQAYLPVGFTHSYGSRMSGEYAKTLAVGLGSAHVPVEPLKPPLNTICLCSNILQNHHPRRLADHAKD